MLKLRGNPRFKELTGNHKASDIFSSSDVAYIREVVAMFKAQEVKIYVEKKT